MPGVNVSLEAVVMAVTEDRPRILTVPSAEGRLLPSGPLLVEEDRTLELGMRRLIDEQTGLEVGYVEQLYTFGDLRRDRRRRPGEPRMLGIAYLVLTREEETTGEWIDVYELMPWEDRRTEPTSSPADEAIRAWADGDPDRTERTQIAFGAAGNQWDPVRALDRYELLYEARLVPEWHTDRDRDRPDGLVPGAAMGRDHRRVVATAVSRLRGKLTYRPVVFEMLPETFTLSQLQRTVEALAGRRLHTQNFRRLVERGGLVEGTGDHTGTGGRPAELFRFRREVVVERPRPGLVR